MEQKLLDELIASIEQAGEILRGECEPARIVAFESKKTTTNREEETS